jgi:hypothetical protein
MVGDDPAAPDWGRILTDEQWAEVARHSRLPGEARASVGQAIVTYRHWQRIIDSRPAPREIRAELDRLRSDAEGLLRRLMAAMSDPDAHVAFVRPLRPLKGWPPGTGPISDEVAHQRLRSATYELERLATWLALARDRIQRGKTGSKRQAIPAYFLINRLNQILEGFTGKTITRSPKRPDMAKYVKTVCRIADPDIGEGTITEAMKKEIKHYKPYGVIPSDLTGVSSPPIRRDNRPLARKVTIGDCKDN